MSIAASFANRKLIAVLMDRDTAYSCEFLRGIAEYQQKRGDILAHFFRGPEADRVAPERYEGVIITDNYIGHIGKFKKAGVPIVDTSGEFLDDPAVVTVDIDCAKIGALAARWFLARGFESFAFYGLTGKHDSDLMRDAFAATVSEKGFNCSVLCEAHENAGQLGDWIAGLPRHTAMLCLNDNFALPAVSWCNETGRDVPRDIAIMGTMNDDLTCITSPIQISSVDMNFYKLGRAALRIMAHIIDNQVDRRRRHPLLMPPVRIVERESTSAFPAGPAWLSNALLLLDANIDRPLTADDMANAAGVSQTALQEAFHKAFGMSAVQYIRSVKMREAKRLADKGGFSIKEIAARTGFSSVSYFSRTYRTFHGFAPSRRCGETGSRSRQPQPVAI